MTTYTIAKIDDTTDYKTYTKELPYSTAKELLTTLRRLYTSHGEWFHGAGFDILVDGVATYSSETYLHMTGYCEDRGCKPSLKRLKMHESIK